MGKYILDVAVMSPLSVITKHAMAFCHRLCADDHAGIQLVPEDYILQCSSILNAFLHLAKSFENEISS